MIRALAEAGAVLDRADYLDAARAAARFVLDEMRDADGRLLRTYNDGEAKLNGYLEDHAFLLEALVALYEATFEPRWLRRRPRARRRDPRALRRPRSAAGSSRPRPTTSALVARRKDLEDARSRRDRRAPRFGLLRLAALTGERRYEEAALGVLRLFADLLPATPGLRPPAAGAGLPPGRPVREVALVGAGGDVRRARARRARRLRPDVVLAGGDGVATAARAAGRPHRPRRRRTAYVCERFACQAPVTDPAALRDFWPATT